MCREAALSTYHAVDEEVELDRVAMKATVGPSGFVGKEAWSAGVEIWRVASRGERFFRAWHSSSESKGHSPFQCPGLWQ
jgi:hypothetical protein